MNYDNWKLEATPYNPCTYLEEYYIKERTDDGTFDTAEDAAEHLLWLKLYEGVDTSGMSIEKKYEPNY